MKLVERICRIICEVEGVNPDGKGWAVRPETEARLGKTFFLWEYRIPISERLIKEFNLKDKRHG